MTPGDRKILMWGALLLSLVSFLPLVFWPALGGAALVLDTTLALFLAFIAWSTEPEDPDDFAPAAGLEPLATE